MDMKNICSIEEMMGTDVSEFPSYINEIIDDKLSKIGQDLTQYHYYTITIDKHITRTNYHSFDMEKVQDISRKFTNGLSTLGSVTNRHFFSNNFVGGVRTTSIHQYIGPLSASTRPVIVVHKAVTVERLMRADIFQTRRA